MSKGTDLGSNFLGPQGKVVGAAVSFATDVPPLVGTTSSGLSGVTNAVITGQKTATGYLLDTRTHAPTAIYTGGKKILGVAGAIGNVQSAVALVTGPGLYSMLGGASLEELQAFRDALDGADLAFFEEWFASDAEELQAYIDELIQARKDELTAKGQEEGAAAHERYVKSLTENNMGACVARGGDANRRNQDWADAAARLRAKLAEIDSRDYSEEAVRAGMNEPGG